MNGTPDSDSVIYVFLPREAVDVWAPVDACHIRDDIYQIVNCRGEDDEVEFGAGAVVRCRTKTLLDGIQRVERLVAFEEAREQ